MLAHTYPVTSAKEGRIRTTGACPRCRPHNTLIYSSAPRITGVSRGQSASVLAPLNHSWSIHTSSLPLYSSSPPPPFLPRKWPLSKRIRTGGHSEEVMVSEVSQRATCLPSLNTCAGDARGGMITSGPGISRPVQEEASGCLCLRARLVSAPCMGVGVWWIYVYF